MAPLTLLGQLLNWRSPHPMGFLEALYFKAIRILDRVRSKRKCYN